MHAKYTFYVGHKELLRVYESRECDVIREDKI